MFEFPAEPLQNLPRAELAYWRRWCPRTSPEAKRTGAFLMPCPVCGQYPPPCGLGLEEEE